MNIQPQPAKDIALYKIEKYFFYLLCIIFLAKLLLAYLVPVTADEAYFWIWGQHLDINYYDHPPLTGWIVWLFSLMGNHIFFSRLFAVLSGLVITVGIYHLVRRNLGAPDKAKLICLAFAVCPLHLLFVLITTDTPVFLLVFLSGLAFFHSLQRQKLSAMVLAGALCGLAILSKYFAGLLAIAFIVTLVYRRDRFKIIQMLCLLAGALPFVLFHIYGNYQTCWTNVLFNVYNRNQEVSWKISGLLLFLAFQIYLGTPWVFYYLLKNIRRIGKGVRQDNNVFAMLFAVPMFLFALVSFHDTGLHWTLGFYPLMYPLLIYLKRSQIKRIVTFSLIFSTLHAAIIFGALAWRPLYLFKNHQYYNDLVMAYHGQELYQAILDRYGHDYVLATNGYYTSSAMTYHSGEYFIIFMDGSKHGRYDDKLTDFRKLEGKNILSLHTLPAKHRYAPFFEKVTYDQMEFKGGTFYVVIGEKFRFSQYRQLYLEKIRNSWYNIPDFLPVGDCYFFDMYFDDNSAE